MALQAVLLGVIILISGQFCSVSRAEPNVCKTYGSGIINPFSKTLFYLKTTCPITLTRFTLLGVNCDVTVQRGSNGLMTRVEILVNKVSTVLQDGKVIVEGNSVSLPFDHMYQLVYEYGIYIKFRSKVLPFTVTWRSHSDGISSLWVQLDHDLVKGMNGMCERKTNESLMDFVPGNIINDRTCITADFISQNPPKRSEVCGVLSNVIRCPGIYGVMAQTYEKYCHLNMYETTNKYAKCAYFEEFARLCGNQPELWPGWRQKTSCEQPTCPGDLKYQELGPPFPPTCTNRQPPSDTLTNTCLPPQGMVLNDRAKGYQCISVKDCPCVHGGKTYPAGAERNTKCQSCACVQGKWTCSDNVCPPTCNIEGQFVTTFDGKQYSVPGKCTYVAALGLSWQVAIKFSDTDSSIAEMHLQVNQDKYTFSKNSVKLGQDEITDLSQTGYATVFWQSSMFVQVQTSFGLKMKVQVSPEIQLYLYLPPTEKTTGLCGTHNNNTEDDFTTSSGIVENAVRPFAQSWTVGECSPPDSSVCINTDNGIYAEDKCSLLTNTSSVFARCHYYVPVNTFVEACVRRTCQCTSGLKNCLCVALSNYAKACASQGIDVGDWRAETDCKISCNGNLRFSYNTVACNQTCRSLMSHDPICDVEVDSVEGCGCLPGTHLNTQEECSPRAFCSCYYQGGTTPPGRVVIDGRDCVCENGNLSCSAACDCPRGKICVHCAHSTVNTAQKTCGSLNKRFSVEENCTNGCYCPPGLFENHNGTCVAREDCTCEFSDKVYASGQSVESNCETCICRGGLWDCEEKPCEGVCEVFGNGQYKTFDSKWYRFDGHCQYTLVEDATLHGHNWFAVRVESVPCCDEFLTCSRAISVDLKDEVTLMLRDMNVTQTLKAGWQPQPLYSVHTLGLHIIISVPDLGLTVVWDKHTRVKIILQASWKGKVHGLCGNFDGKVMNDLLTSSSSVVSSPLEFGNSWKTAVPPCSDVTKEVFPCQRHSYCEAWAQRRCMILQSDTFSDCHLKVDPAPYYQACILESCSCEFEGRFLGFCTAVAAYAEACTTQNVCINWRTPDLCPVYCDYYNEGSECGWHYDPCGQMKTCGKKHSFTGRLEGCYPRCPPEMPYFDENTRKCSSLDNCTCDFNSTTNLCKCIRGQILCDDHTPDIPTTIITSTEIPSTTKGTEYTTPITLTTPETTVSTTTTTEIPYTTKGTASTTPVTTATPETTTSTTTTTEIPDTTEGSESTTPLTTTTPETTTSTTTTTEIPDTTKGTESTTPLTTTTPETTTSTTTTTEIPDTTKGTESTTPLTTTTPETTTTSTTTTTEIPDTTKGTASTTPLTTTTPETTTSTTTTTEIPDTTKGTESTTPIITTTPETTTSTTTTTEIPDTTKGTESTTPVTTTTPETTTTSTTTTTEIPSTTKRTESTTPLTTTTPETTTTTEIPDTTKGTESTTPIITTTPETTTSTTTTTEIPDTTKGTESTTPLTTTTPETTTTSTTTTTEIPSTTKRTESTTPITLTTPETTVSTTTTTEIPDTTKGTASTTPLTTTTPETTTTSTTTTTEIPDTTKGTESTTPLTTTTPETTTRSTTTTTEIPDTTKGTASTTPLTTTTPETTTSTTTTTEIPDTTKGTESTTPTTTTTPETTTTSTTTTTEIPSTTKRTESTTPLTTTTPETTTTTEIPDTTKGTESTTPIITTTPETTTSTTTTTEIPDTTKGTESTTPTTTTTPETTTTSTTTTTEIPSTTKLTESTTPLTTTTPETTTTTEIPDTTKGTESTTPIITTTPETTTSTTTTTEIPDTTKGTESTTPTTTTTPETTTTSTTTTTEIPSTTKLTESTTPLTTTTPETTTTTEIPDTTKGTESTTPIITTTPETTTSTTTTTEIPYTTKGTASTTPIITTTPETTTTSTTTTTEIPDTTKGTASTTPIITTTPETTTSTTTTTEIPDTTKGTASTTPITTTTPEITTTTEIPDTTKGTESTTPIITTTPETTTSTTTTTEIPDTTEGSESTTPLTTATPETTTTSTTTTTEIPDTTKGTASTTPITTTTPETTTSTTTTTEIPDTTEGSESTTPLTTTTPETTTTSTTTTTEIPDTTKGTESTTPIITTTPETTTSTTTTTEIPDTTKGTESTTPLTTTTPETTTTSTTTTTEIPDTTKGTESTTPTTTITPETTTRSITTTTEIPDTTKGTESTTPLTTTTPETTTTSTTTTTEIPDTTKGTESTTPLTTTTPETTTTSTTTTTEIPDTTKGTASTTPIITTTPETTTRSITTTTEIPDTTKGTASTTPIITTTPETTTSTTTTTEIPDTTKGTESTTPLTTTTPETTTTSTTTTTEIPDTTKGTASTTPIITTTPETTTRSITTTTEIPDTTKGTASTTPIITTTPETTTSTTTTTETPTTTIPVYTHSTITPTPREQKDICFGLPPIWTEDCYIKMCRNNTIEMRRVECPIPIEPECPRDLMRLVKDEQGCCDIWQCDCQCELYGDPHYISFSGTTFDFLDNCTYTLVKETNPRHQFSISVDNYYSSPWLPGSSVKGVILKYGEATATLQLNPENYTVEATLDGVAVQPPYEKHGISFESTDFTVSMYINKIRSYISFDLYKRLQITLAMEHFQNNTMGQCGVCGGPACIRRDGRVESDDCCSKTAYDWIEEDPLKPYCTPNNITCTPVTPLPTLPPCEAPVCELLRHEVFRNCSQGIDVETLVKNCKFDYCVVGNITVCSSLQQLSEQCKRQGYCVYWRNLTKGACDVTCPEGMIFDECRSTPDDVCQGGIRVPGKFSTDNMRSGCFCPDNMSLAESHKTFCVPECTNCKGPLGEPMPPGAVWESNCHRCTCNNQTLTEDCSPMPSAPAPKCSADSMLVSGCCGSQMCVERTCEYNGKTYKVGHTWKDPSQPCVSFSCTSAGTKIERGVCPEQSCPEEFRVWDKQHCSYSCNVTCAVRMSSMTIAFKGCTQEVELPSCEGYCPSKSMILGAKEVLQLKRRCCREKEYETRQIPLTCKDAAPVQYTYHHITSCECQSDA